MENSPGTRFKELKLDQAVQGLVTRFERVEQYYGPQTANLFENIRFYWAMYAYMGLGQWPATHIAKMIQAGRQLTQYNMILPIIDAIQSSIVRVPVEPSFIPLDSVAKQLTQIAKHMYYTDRELLNWDTVLRELVLHGLMQEGVIQVKIDNRFHPLGNIGIENCCPGAVFFHPFWKSGKRKDMKVAYKKSWMSALDIWKDYGLERAKMEHELNLRNGETFGPFLGATPYDYSSGQWGTMHLIYEEFFMTPVEQRLEVIIGPNGEETEMPDIADEDKPAFLDTFLPTWDKTSVYEDTYKTEECRVRTTCPTLAGDRLLVDGEVIEEQIGSPPFLRWAANQLNGQCRGLVEQLKDPQINKNFLEAELLRKIQSEGGGGSKFVDKSLFSNPKEAEKFERYSNRPDMKFYVKPGSLRKGLTPSTPVETTGIPAQIVEHNRHIERDVFPLVSKRPPVAMGQTEQGQQTSGLLFKLMDSNADEQIEGMITSYRDFNNDLDEGYLMQVGQQYSNEMLPREFTYKGGTMIANEPVETQRGGIFIRNDIRGLLRTRMKIVISSKQASPTQKASTANILLRLAKTQPPQNIGTVAVINHEVMKRVEELDDEARVELEEMAKLEKDVVKSQLVLQKLKLQEQISAIQTQGRPALPAPGTAAAPGAQPGPKQPAYEVPVEQLSEEDQMAAAQPNGMPEPITQEEA